jgi:o-succinylbenzoate synthase
MKIESIVLRELSMSLVHPFATSFGETRERRVVLVEVRSEGLSGWGECTAGEHPFFNEESTDTAWVTILHELAPLLTAAEEASGGKCAGIFRSVRGNRMAKAALENAVWDLDAQMREVPLYELLGGIRETIVCGVSIGIQPGLEKLLEKVETALSQGYQRIKLKCKPGWDVEMFEAVRQRSLGRVRSIQATDDRAAIVGRRFLFPRHVAATPRYGNLPR